MERILRVLGAAEQAAGTTISSWEQRVATWGNNLINARTTSIVTKCLVVLGITSFLGTMLFVLEPSVAQWITEYLYPAIR